MNKLALLRQHLLDSPLKIESDNLIVLADKGKALSESAGSNQDFELHYIGKVIVTEYTKGLDALMFLVLQWYHEQNPGHPIDGCRFEADILSHEAADVEIQLDLTETVGVQVVEGGIQLNHCLTPSLEPMLLPAEDWSGYVNDDPTLEWINGG